MSNKTLERGKHPLCVEGTWGCDFYGEVRPLPEDIVVVKHRFNAFIDTDLNLILRSMGVRTLIFTGIATHVCVESTVRHAFFYDYYNVVVRDCVATWDDELHRVALKNMDFLFGQVVDSKEFGQVVDSRRFWRLWTPTRPWTSPSPPWRCHEWPKRGSDLIGREGEVRTGAELPSGSTWVIYLQSYLNGHE